MLKALQGNNVYLLSSSGRLNYVFDGYVIVINPAPNTKITVTIDNGTATDYTSLTSFKLQKNQKLKCTYASTNSAYSATATNCDGVTRTIGTDITSTMYEASTSSSIKTYSVTLTATKGTVSPSSLSDVQHGSSVDWEAVANVGYHLSGQSNGVRTASGTISGITSNISRNVATFVINQYTASISSDVDYGEWNSTSSITNINHGSAISVTRGEQKLSSDTSGTETLTVTINGASRTIETEEFSEQYWYLIYSYLPSNVYSDFNISDYIRVERYVHTAAIDFSDSSTSYAGSWTDSDDRISNVPYGTAISYSYSNQTNSSTSGNASVTITIEGYGTRTFTATDSATAQYYYTISLSATNNTAVTGNTTTNGKYINYTPAITRNTHTYSLTWNPSGDTNPGVDVTVNSSSAGSAVTSYSSTQDYGTTYSFSPKSKTGYTGSLVSGSLSGTVTGNTTVSYKWTENSYSILYRNGVAEGGSLSVGTSSYNFSSNNAITTQLASQSRKYTASATIGTNSGTKPNYAKTGTYSVKYNRGTADSTATVPSEQRVNETWKYTASGWNTASDGTGTNYANGATVAANSTTSLTLYPKFSTARQSWETIPLATNSMAKSNTTATGCTVTYNRGTANSNATVPSSQTATNTYSYTADGWNTASNGSGTSYSNGYPYTPSANLSLYPKYNTTLTFGTVKLATNSMAKSNSSGTSYTIKYYQGTATGGTVPSSQTATDTISYSASGWNTASDGSGTNYANGANYTASANLSLYPKYTSSTTHGSVTLATNSMTKSQTIDATYTITYNNNDGSGTTSTTTAKKRRNYTANGWTTTSGSTTRDYASGQSVSVSADINLYPCFSSSTSTDNVTLKSLTRTGYAHSGWNTKSDASGTHYAKSSSYTPSSDITLYAEWTVETYNITLDKNLGTNASGYWKNSSNTTITAINDVAYGTAISVSGNVLTVGNNTYTWVPSASAEHYHVASSSISIPNNYTSMPATGFTITGNATAAIDTFAMYFENGTYGAWYNGSTASTAPITGIAYGTSITYSQDSDQTNSSTSGQITWTVTIGNQTRTYKSPSANAQYYYGITANQSATTVTGNLTFKPTVSRSTHTYTMTFTNNTNGTWDSTTSITGVAYGTTISYSKTDQTNASTSGKATWAVTVGSTTRTFSSSTANAQYYYTLTANQSGTSVGGALTFKPTCTQNTHTYSMTFEDNTYGAWDSKTAITANYGTTISYQKDTNQTNSSTSGKISWKVTIGSTTRTFTTSNAANAQYYYGITGNQTATSVSGALNFKPTVTRNTHTYTVSFTNPSYGSWGSATKTVAYGVTWSTNGTTVTFSDGQTNTVTKSSPTARTLTFAESDSGNYGSWNSTSSVSVYDYSYTTPTVGNGSGTVTGTATITASNSRSAVTFTNTLTAQPTNSSTSGAQTWTISGTNTAGNSFSRVYTMATNTAQYYYYMTRSSSATSVTANTEFKATTNRATHSYTLTITLNSNVSSIDIEWDQGTGGTTTYTSSTTAIALYGQTIYATATAASGYQISDGTNLNSAITVTGNLTVSATASRQQRTMTFTNGAYGSWNSTASLTVEEGTAITYTKSSDQTNSNTSGTITWKVTIGSTTRTYTTPAATAQYYYGITANQSASSVSADMNFKPTVSRSTHTYSMTFANGSYGSWNSTTSLTVNYGTSISYTKSANQTNSTTSGAMTWKVTIGSTTRTYTAPNANSTYYYEMTANQSASSVSGAMQFKPTVTRKTHTSGASWHTVFSGDYPCEFAENETYTDNIVSDSHLTSSNKVRVTFGWYLMDIEGNVTPISDDSPEFYSSTSLSGPYNGWSNTADTYIDIYIENGSLMVDTTTEGMNEYTQYVQVIDVTKVEVYY